MEELSSLVLKYFATPFSFRLSGNTLSFVGASVKVSNLNLRALAKGSDIYHCLMYGLRQSDEPQKKCALAPV